MDLFIGPQPDEERTRDFEHNGYKFKLKAHDPYGFVKITSLTGNKTLDGQYTSFTEAQRAAINHVTNVLLPRQQEKLKKV